MPKYSEEKWGLEKAALKKIQLHFSFQAARNDQIQHDAIDHGIKPSDMIRKIVGLPFKKIQRPHYSNGFQYHTPDGRNPRP